MADIVGVAGCGRMGMGMLRNLQKAGFEARGFDVRPLEGVGTSVSEFVAGLTTLITVVRDTTQTDALLFDDQAVIKNAAHLTCIVISSTLSPNMSKVYANAFLTISR